MQLNRLVPFALALLLGAGGCLGGSTELIDATGTYVLVSVNGKPLPYTYATGGTVRSEVLTLNGDATYTDVITRPDGTVLTDVGNYNNFAGNLNFADQTIGALYQGTLQARTLTLVIGSYTEIFNRQ